MHISRENLRSLCTTRQRTSDTRANRKRAEASGWREASELLAEWTNTHLVNRRDCWGQYIPPARRSTPERKTFTAPPLNRRGIELLGRPQLVSHYSGHATLGLHTTSASGTSRFLAYDLDAHGPLSSKAAAANLEAAARLCAELLNAGAFPLIEDSDGRGGLHLWVIFSSAIATPDVFHFGEGIRTRAGVARVELFPKQPRLEAGRFGNWLRLPGRHHTLDHWSRFAETSTCGADTMWLSGAAACRALLGVPITPADVVPTKPVPRPKQRRSASVARWPMSQDGRLSRYVAKVERALSDGRKRRAFAFAAALFHNFDLGEAETRALLEAWNRDNLPPLDAAVLGQIIANAKRYGGSRGTL